MLYLVFELGQVLDNTLALFALLLVGLVAHGAMQVVDRASLSRQIQHTSTFPPRSQRKDTLFLTRITGHRSCADTYAKLDLSEVRYSAMMYGGVSLALF